MKKQRDLHVFGCSFSDIDFPICMQNDFSIEPYKIWSNILSDELNLNLISHAKSGISNNTIFKLLSTVNFKSDDIILLQLTHLIRFGLFDLNTPRMEIGSSTISTLQKENGYINYPKTKFMSFFNFIENFNTEIIDENFFFLMRLVERLKTNNIKLYIISNDDILPHVKKHDYLKEYLIINNLVSLINNKGLTWYEDIGLVNQDGTPEGHPSKRGNEYIYGLVKDKIRDEIT